MTTKYTHTPWGIQEVEEEEAVIEAVQPEAEPAAPVEEVQDVANAEPQ